MKSLRGLLLGASMAMTLSSVASGALAQGAPDLGGEPYDYEYLFPIFGNKLAERGIHFPLPWGFGVNYAYMNQGIDISDVSIAVNDSDFVNITEFIEFEKVRSTVQAVNARLDLWLFPFLSVYALGNYAFQASTEVVLDKPFSIDAGANQQGYGGGFGFTGAFGVLGFFATADLNWTWNKLQLLNAPVRTFLLTPRVGKNFHNWLSGVAFWVGAMRQNIQAATEGSISLRDTLGGENLGGFKDKLGDWYDGLPPLQQILVDGVVGKIQDLDDPTIHYKLDKRVAHRWNMLVGTEVGLSDAWRLRAEVGFIGRTQVIVGVNYRFGLIHKSKSKSERAAPARPAPLVSAPPRSAGTTAPDDHSRPSEAPSDESSTSAPPQEPQ